MKRENVAAFASGMKGCGKSRLLWDLYASRHPRVLTYDPVGDTRERSPNAIPVSNWRELWRHLKGVTSQGADRWHFAVYGSPDDMREIMDKLLPPNIAPDAPTLSRALGGVLLESGEVDLLAPNAGTPLSIAMRGKWQRGRHGLVSFAVGTQAPALVSRIVTGNSDDLYIFAHSERTSLNHWRAELGDRAADVIARLGQFEYLHWHKGAPFADKFKTQLRGNVIKRIAIVRVPLLLASVADSSYRS